MTHGPEGSYPNGKNSVQLGAGAQGEGEFVPGPEFPDFAFVHKPALGVDGVGVEVPVNPFLMKGQILTDSDMLEQALRSGDGNPMNPPAAQFLLPATPDEAPQGRAGIGFIECDAPIGEGAVVAPGQVGSATAEQLRPLFSEIGVGKVKRGLLYPLTFPGGSGVVDRG